MMRSRLLLALSLAAWLGGQTASAQEIPRFNIERFEVAGNTLLPAELLQRSLAPFTGPQRDFGDVQGALEALEAAFRDHGYTTVSVLLPEQALEHGTIRLRVIEGRVRRIEIEGNQSRDADNVRASLPTLKEGEVPRVSDVSASLRVANENPSRKINLQLAAGETEEDLIAKVQVTDEKPWTAGLTLDNTGTPQTGRRRLGFTYQHSNLWNRDHVLTLQHQTSPEKPRDVKVYAAIYRLPLYGLGDALDVYATRSNVNAGNIAAGAINLAITGRGSVLGGRYTWNLKRHGDYEHSLAFGLERKHFDNSILAGAVQLGNELVVRPFSLLYTGRLAQADGENSLSLGLVRNLPGGGKAEQEDFDVVRTGSDKDYVLLKAGATLSRAFAEDWQWRVVLNAQWAHRPLVPGEQFGVGGAASVRGFLEREVSGDRGHQASFELYTPEWCEATGLAGQCRALVFYDAGTAFRLKALPGEKEREGIASAGAGLRWSLGRQAAVQADYARVLQSGASQGRGNWMLHARIGLLF